MPTVRPFRFLRSRPIVVSLAVAGAVTLVVIAGWGFLANAGLPEVDWTTWIVPLLIGTWIFGVLRMTRKYR